MIIQSDQEGMQWALRLARKAGACNEVPVGAILVLDNYVIGEGWNSPISTVDPTAHAEIVALRMAAKKMDNYRLPHSTLYVTLEPCFMCLGALLHTRVKRVVFGAFDSRTGAVSYVSRISEAGKLNHQIIYEGGVLADACSQLLKDFFQVRR